MYIPKGYTEEMVLKAMDEAIKSLAVSFQFGCYSADDMRQEGYLFAMEALPDYREGESSLTTYLKNCVRNRFINMRRDKLERRQPPCLNCPFYNKSKKACATFTDQSECQKWSNWQNRNKAKRALMESYNGDEIHEEKHEDTEILDGLVQSEALELIDLHMPTRLRADYRRMVEGAKLPKHKRVKVIEAARNILVEHGVLHGEEENR